MPSKQSFALSLRFGNRYPRSHKRIPQLTSIRSLTTTGSLSASAVDVDNDPSTADLSPPNPHNARIVPASPSYFSGTPSQTDCILKLQRMLRQYQTLPVVPRSQAPRIAWRTPMDMSSLIGEIVYENKYKRIIKLLQRISLIHPAMMPKELADFINPYKRTIQPSSLRRRIQVVDEDGRAVGIGRRKSSSAKVYLVQGDGEVLVNGKTINNVFNRIHDRESALWALKATQRIDKYNVWALVKGGGLTGQAEAITLGTANALLIHEPALKPALRRGKSPKRFLERPTFPLLPLKLHFLKAYIAA